MKSFLGLLGGFLVILVSLGVGRFIHGSFNQEFALTLLLGITGVAFGWSIGFLISPYTTLEEKKFTKLSTAIIGFLSGYVFSKTEPLFSEFLQPAKLQSILANPDFSIYFARILIFLICLLIGIMNMYTYRSYLDLKKDEQQDEPKNT